MFEYGKQRIEYEIKNGCWECKGRYYGSNGYPQIRVNHTKIYNIHRFIFIMEKNNGVDLPRHIVVRHTCDNTKCINPDHLILGTQTDNMRDASKRTKWKRQFSDSEIKYMRLSVQLGIKKQIELAEMFGVTRGYISEIINFKIYKNV